MTERKATLAHAQNSLGAALLKKLLDEVAALRQPWANTSESEQQQVINRLRDTVHQATDQAVRQVAAIGFTGYAGDLESMGVKDGVKLTITISKHVARIDELVAHVGMGVMLVLADSTTYTEGMQKIKAQTDQPDLPLDAEEPAGSVADQVSEAMGGPTPEPTAQDQDEAARALQELEQVSEELPVARQATASDQLIPADAL